MFKEKKWSLTGASGAEYHFDILPKSQELPQSPGVFILAYTHPRGHVAGWAVNPLLVSHADNMRRALASEAELSRDRKFLWNSNLVLLESDASARETCVRDLHIQESKQA
ncbi:hypothetical protein [Paucidesulfovibrio longus]|uniref:hypothetical protein n=1 Tax=Paucidesulfovibrio longus TaxID=889 RepID=UPI0003B6935D|nr:hypothetical protein [Paucidesulfovibrio longus]